VVQHGFGEAKVPAGRVRGFTAPAPIGVRLADTTVRLIAPENIAAVSAADALELLRPIRIAIFTPMWKFWGASGRLGFSDNSGASRSRGASADLQLARVDNGREAVAVLNGGSEVKQRIGPALFDWKASWSGSVKDFSDFRLRSSATLTATVYRGLGFRLGLQNDYNNRPRPDRVSHDMLFTTTLAYSVGVLR